MKNGFKGGVASLEGDNLVVIYYFTICPDGELRNNSTVFEELEVSIVDCGFDGRKCRFTGDAKQSQ
jgi:hypothetical protein